MSDVQLETSNDQPNAESNDVNTSQVSTPNVDGSDGQPEKEPVTETETTKVSLQDGTEVTLDELKAGYMKDSDYRQKTTALAEKEREIARETSQPTEDIDPEIAKAVNVLKGAGMATKEDLINMQSQQEDEKKLQKLFESNPTLKANEKAIRAIGKTDNSAWEDIATNYGFTSKDKLAKAKASRPVVGYSVPQESETVSVKNMTDAQYDSWKQNNLGGSGFFTKQ